MSPDGTLLVRDMDFGSAGFFPLPDGNELTKPEGWIDGPRDVAWRPGDTLFAVAGSWGHHGEGGGCTIFDRSLAIRWRVEADFGARTAAFSPDGKALAWTDHETVHMLDVESLQELRSAPARISWWRFLDDRLALARGESWELRDARTLKVLRAFDKDDFRRSPGVSPDGRHVAASDGRIVRVWRIER